MSEPSVVTVREGLFMVVEFVRQVRHERELALSAIRGDEDVYEFGLIELEKCNVCESILLGALGCLPDDEVAP